jgi:hypothetical protein
VFLQRIALQAANHQLYVKGEEDTHEDTVLRLNRKCGEIFDRNASETTSITVIHLGQHPLENKMVD